MDVLKLIANDNFITTNKTLIKRFGLIEANLVGLFASIHNYNESEHQRRGKIFDGWFYATYERLNEELGLSQYVASKPIEKLIEVGILLDKKQGVPCRRFFKFNQENLLNALLSRNLITGNEKTPSQGNEELDNNESNNSTASDQEAPQQGDEKLDRNKKTKKNLNKNLSLSRIPTLEICIAHAEKEKFLIDVEKFFKFYFVDSDKKYRSTWQQLMRTWAEKPSNQVAKKSLATDAKIVEVESPEIIKIGSDIKFILGNSGNASACQYFSGKPIEKTSSGFVIKVSDEKALDYQEILNSINIKIEVKT